MQTEQGRGSSAKESGRAGKLAVIAAGLAAASFGATESAVAAEQRAVNLQNLAQQVVPANVRLYIHKEGSPSQGSATMVQTPEELKDLIKPGEVLAITAGHVCWDYKDTSTVEAHVFKRFSGSRPGDHTSYSGRVIQYYPANGEPDVGLIAINVGEDVKESLTLVPIGGEEAVYEFGTYAITVGCPAGSDSIWKDSRVLNHSEESETIPSHVTGIALVKGGHSGGGLFNAKGELIGVCSGSGEVTPGTIDFMVPGAENIQARTPEEFRRKLSALCPDWAEYSRGRTSFTPSGDIHDIIDTASQSFQKAKDHLAKIQTSSERVKEKVWEATEDLPEAERKEIREHFLAIATKALEAAQHDVDRFLH